MSNHTPPTQAELDAWKEKGVPLNAMIRLIAEVERLRAEHAELHKKWNLSVSGDKAQGLLLKIARLTKEVEELRKDKERLTATGLLWSATFQKYESWKANKVVNVPIEQILIDYRKCDAMQQKERDEEDFNEDAGKV